ncbi:discoidin domain-containing protein [Roseibacillus ishigakijimensis]|uniref:Discoidin domain-containing protein n=1 Tax=Roseibacillus ishigakijimensis TaxID=454146 RepID=A0A934RIZ6_9BACT|nr:discoidin domain-containing protein [Roseibacillus ishigakijimensis]MBK1832507.1 discoidin domain-containing protein [Roseibacillus ishigakijimensis]
MKKHQLLKPWLAALGLFFGLSQAQATMVRLAVDLSAGTAGQSTTHSAQFAADRAIDGILTNVTNTLTSDPSPRWWVDFPVGDEIAVQVLRIHNRDNCCQARLSDITITLLNSSDNVIETVGPLNVANVDGGPEFLEVEFPSPISDVATIEISRINSTAEQPGVLAIAEVQAFVFEEQKIPLATNIGRVETVNRIVSQSSSNASAANGVDGNYGNFTHTLPSDENPAWTIDFGEDMVFQATTIFNRVDCCPGRFRDLFVEVLASDDSVLFKSDILNPGNELNSPSSLSVDLMTLNDGAPFVGQKLRISRVPLNEDPQTADGAVLSMSEVEIYGGSPFPDTDNDGMDDDYETQYGLNIGTDDSGEDADGDGLTNIQEFNGTGVANYLGGTDPTNADVDEDGLNDFQEVSTHQTDPFVADTDEDGLLDGEEVNTTNTDPHQFDSDGDTYSDGMEVSQGSNPNDPNSVPIHTMITTVSGLLGGDITNPYNHGVETPAETGTFFNWKTITATSQAYFNAPEGAFNIFDNRIGGANDKWCCESPPQAVTLEMHGSYSLTHFTVTSSNDSPERDPREWAIQGSNDGVTWENIYPVPGSADDPSGGGNGLWTGRNQTRRFDLPDPSASYRYFRYQVETTGSNLHALGEIEFFGTVDETDSDNDGLPDWYESKYAFLNPNDPSDASLDEDGDLLSNLEEYQFTSEPGVADTEGDGVDDKTEKDNGANPYSSDSDVDGFTDLVEVARGSDPADAGSLPPLDPINFVIVDDEAYQPITGTAADFDTRGQLVYAWNGGAIDVTVFGIPFQASNLLGSTASGLDPWNQRPDSDPNYETLLDTISWSSARPRILEIPNLVIGEEYLIQFWVADTRSGTSDRTYFFETNNMNSVGLLAGNTSNNPPDVGEFAVATFTPTMSDTMYVFADGTAAAQYNAIMVRQLTGVVYDPEITGIVHDGNEVTISATGLDAAVTYELRSSPDLATPFAPLTPAVEVTGQATADFVDPSPAADRRFYQVWQVVPATE